MTSDFGWDDKINGHPINLGGKKKQKTEGIACWRWGNLRLVLALCIPEDINFTL